MVGDRKLIGDLLQLGVVDFPDFSVVVVVVVSWSPVEVD